MATFFLLLICHTVRLFLFFLHSFFLLLSVVQCTSEIRFDGEDNFVFAVPFSMLPMTIDESDRGDLLAVGEGRVK